MSSRSLRLRKIFPVAPRGVFVREGTGFKTPVQNADKPVPESPECVIMFESLGDLLVVEGSGARRPRQSAERLGVRRIDKPVIMHEPGGDDLLLARCPGDRAGGGVVLAGLGVVVAVRVVAELAEHPGAEDGAYPGLGQVDLSVRGLPKMLLHLPLQGLG